jgi:hypothetical protein
MPPDNRRAALLALLLIAPAPSAGVVAALLLKQSTLGTLLWAGAKVWLFALPLVWHRWVDRQPWSFSPPRKGGFGVAAISGLLIGAIIVAGYLLVGKNAIDRPTLAGALEPVGLTRPAVYLAAAAYWIAVNSVLEEYVYRWFVFRQAERLAGPGPAVAISGLVFVIHHALAMSAYFPAWLNAVASLSIFIGGALWSWLYLRHRSVWVPWLSHALVDLAIFALGAVILFG